MANESTGGPQTFKAAADLSASQYCAVRMTATGVNLTAVDGHCLGILQNKPTALNKPARVECRPGRKLIAISGGAVNPGDRLRVTAAGKFVVCAGADITAGKAVAVCVEGAGVADRRIVIILGCTNII